MLLGISVSNSNYQMLKRALNILCKSIINRPTEGLRIALKIKTKQNKNQEMFIRWLLKVGLGINLQSTIGISVRSKAPRLLPTSHSALSSIFHDFFGTTDPSGVPITKVLLLLLHFIKLPYKKPSLRNLCIQHINTSKLLMSAESFQRNFPKLRKNFSISTTTCHFQMTKLLHI